MRKLDHFAMPGVKRHAPAAATSQGRRGKRPESEGQEEEDDYHETDQSLSPELMSSVIKIYTMHCEPNFSLPWQKRRQFSSTSSGFACVYKGKTYLLTNAHSVEYHSQVQVKKRGDEKKYIAEVLSVGVECDIAMLDVKDKAFWSGISPLKFADALPRLQDEVAVVGYPVGGDTVSITAGVVSRIEVIEYTHGSPAAPPAAVAAQQQSHIEPHGSASQLLAIQIDAAINEGNSGGPVFSTEFGDCVGIAFQALVGKGIESVGYVIPIPVVQHFLDDYISANTYRGFPSLGVTWQSLDSEALRSYLGMKQQQGVLIRQVNCLVSQLKPDDILLSFDGVQIGSDGTVSFRTGERIAWSYLVTRRFIGDKVTVQVLRNEKITSLTLQLSKPKQLVPSDLSGKNPSYFLAGGLVFCVCSELYLESEYGPTFESQAPVKIIERLYYGVPKSEEEELVVLSQVLACESTRGYEMHNPTVVNKVNGTPVKNLLHLASMVVKCTDKFCRFELDHNQLIVVDTSSLFKSTKAVMASHFVPSAMSADLTSSLGSWPPRD